VSVYGAHIVGSGQFQRSRRQSQQQPQKAFINSTGIATRSSPSEIIESITAMSGASEMPQPWSPSPTLCPPVDHVREAREAERGNGQWIEVLTYDAALMCTPLAGRIALGCCLAYHLNLPGAQWCSNLLSDHTRSGCKFHST